MSSFLSSMTRREAIIVDEDDVDVDGALLRRRSMSEDGRGTDRGRGGVHFFLPIIDVVVVDDEDGDNEVDLHCSTPPPPTGPTRCIEGTNSSSSLYALPLPPLRLTSTSIVIVSLRFVPFEVDFVDDSPQDTVRRACDEGGGGPLIVRRDRRGDGGGPRPRIDDGGGAGVLDFEGDANSSSPSSASSRRRKADFFDHDDVAPPLLPLPPRDCGGSGPRSMSSTTTVPPTVVREFILLRNNPSPPRKCCGDYLIVNSPLALTDWW